MSLEENLFPRCVLLRPDYSVIPFGRCRTPIVAVPVRDEVERLPKLLTALSQQGFKAASGAALPVVLVFNNCRDDSAEVAACFAQKLSRIRLVMVDVEFPAERAHVGSARRLAMETALAEVGDESVLISTDADAVPASNWVDANLQAIAAGADLVGGRIIGDPAEEALLGHGFCHRAEQQKRYNALLDELASIVTPLPFDPWPRHTDHTGASLAVRGDVYRSLGGMPPIAWQEDIAFVAKARRAGFRLRHDPRVVVQVSARLEGRAKGGMADCIRSWVKADAEGLPHLVEDPATVLQRLLRRSPDAISLRSGPARGNTLNVTTETNVIGQEIRVDVAITRLKQMIAEFGTRSCHEKIRSGFLTTP
jgi:hypothetical protein